MKKSAGVACLLALATSSSLLAKERTTSVLYCIQSAKNDWSLQRFKPLIRVEGGTTFSEMTFDGPAVQEVKLRQFYPDWILAFDYKFDAAGQLAALAGSVLVKDPEIRLEGDTGPPQITQWLAEAELTPGPDGKIPPHHVLYTRDKDRIDKPDNADKYISRFDEAPVYRTIQAVPCATMMKEAERLNATQE